MQRHSLQPNTNLLSFLNVLPPELLGMILSYFEFAQLMRLKRVSKEMANLVNRATFVRGNHTFNFWLANQLHNPTQNPKAIAKLCADFPQGISVMPIGDESLIEQLFKRVIPADAAFSYHEIYTLHKLRFVFFNKQLMVAQGVDITPYLHRMNIVVLMAKNQKDYDDFIQRVKSLNIRKILDKKVGIFVVSLCDANVEITNDVKVIGHFKMKSSIPYKELSFYLLNSLINQNPDSTAIPTSPKPKKPGCTIS